ncbi:hypothetical protein, variant [Aphanomyces invadans]|uniref:Tr-type G domain-containing protein n=1 Tax=Aphanomyces invadans TaxID=157072 RepID=A0A024T7N0_9STRA|nr:hypothetical protein, variant [Aphanomyces invadans]ETV89858.1 hypothetical protein, variant [Aphanomyces invadans]|eukprot:XP_008881511.1 hypothetical protein, variant [Aphanomyces invadans]
MLRQGIAASRRAASWCTRRSFASKPKKPVVLNDYTRVRDLAKKLKVSADDVVKQACRKHYHKYYMTHHDIQYKFDSLKQVILPLDLAARIADHFGATVAYESVEPQDIESDPSLGVLVPRPPVIAVMGHVDHGKTTLMDTLRGANIAQFEVEKITQKIHVCDTTLAPDVPVTFLDTPGHFHFTRMRNNAAGVADAVVLVVAADEGCRLQTDESIGCIEDLDVPTVVCVNKMDLVPPSTFDKICDEIKEYVALETSPVLPISAKEGTNLDVLKQTLLNVLETQVLTMHAHVDRGTQGNRIPRGCFDGERSLFCRNNAGSGRVDRSRHGPSHPRATWSAQSRRPLHLRHVAWRGEEFDAGKRRRRGDCNARPGCRCLVQKTITAQGRPTRVLSACRDKRAGRSDSAPTRDGDGF